MITSRIIQQLLVSVVVILVSCGSFADSEGYSQIKLSQLTQEDIDEHHQKSTEQQNVYAFGHIVKDSNPLNQNHYWLIETYAGCCSQYRVAIQISGNIEDYPPETNRVAVFGNIVGINSAGNTNPQFPHQALEITNMSISIEKVVPAEELLVRDNILKLLDTTDLSYFSRAVRESGLYESLSNEPSITVFAPIDQAFNDLGADRLKDLFNEAHRDELKQLVLRHVVPDRLSSSQLYQINSISTLGHISFVVNAENGKLHIGGSRTLLKDISGSNGTAHVIRDILDLEHSTDTQHLSHNHSH